MLIWMVKQVSFGAWERLTIQSLMPQAQGRQLLLDRTAGEGGRRMALLGRRTEGHQAQMHLPHQRCAGC